MGVLATTNTHVPPGSATDALQTAAEVPRPEAGKVGVLDGFQAREVGTEPGRKGGCGQAMPSPTIPRWLGMKRTGPEK